MFSFMFVLLCSSFAFAFFFLHFFFYCFCFSFHLHIFHYIMNVFCIWSVCDVDHLVIFPLLIHWHLQLLIWCYLCCQNYIIQTFTQMTFPAICSLLIICIHILMFMLCITLMSHGIKTHLKSYKNVFLFNDT